MPTIDQLDIGIHNQYANRAKMMEQLTQDFRVSTMAQGSATIPPLANVLNLYPQQSEMDLLLGKTAVHTPWAYFQAPEHFTAQRQSVFSFSSVLPSLAATMGKTDDERMTFIQNIKCQTNEDKQEQSVIQNCWEQIQKITGWMEFIIGRVGQFIQG